MDKEEEQIIKNHFSAEVSFDLDKKTSESLYKAFGLEKYDKLYITVEKLWNEYKKQNNLVDTLKEKLKQDYADYIESVKRYEEMRRNTTSEFYTHSYQTTIHKLNAKREYIISILKELEG